MTTIFYDHNILLPTGTKPAEVIEWSSKNNIDCRVGAMYAIFKHHEDGILFMMVFGKGTTSHTNFQI